MDTSLHWPSCTRGRFSHLQGKQDLQATGGVKGVTTSIKCLKPHVGTGDVRAAVPPPRGRPQAAGSPVIASTAPTASTVEDGWTLVVPRGQRCKGALPSSSPDFEARGTHMASKDPPFSLRRIRQYFVSINARVFYCEIYQFTRVTRLAHLFRIP
jgi:hypothetical protein